MLLIRLELIWVLFLSRNQYIHTGNAATWMGRDKLDWVWGKKKNLLQLVSVVLSLFLQIISFQDSTELQGPFIHHRKTHPSTEKWTSTIH